MSLESDFFKKKRVKFETLLPYGFSKEGEEYVYKESFMNGDFEALINISAAGVVSGRVLDTDMGDDYLALRAEHQTGSFVGQVREAYAEILGKIAHACFEAQPFIEDQTNRLAQRLEQIYGDKYDHPFKKYPAFSSYRYPLNRKWYGLIMAIERGKLDLGEEKWDKEELRQQVEVINLKVKSDDLAELLTVPGIYPSYHMNKKSWISVVLDGTVTDEQLFSLVDNSRALVSGKSLGNPAGPDFWIIPANLKYYDIDAEFATHKINIWPQKASIQTGDYLFIYITAPTRALRYACRVLESGIQRPHVKRKQMKLELLKKYEDSDFPIERLKAHGVTNIRGPRRMTASLIDDIKPSLKDS
ncbi:MmcQ/YjbR family DNA-binding protein [Streptococcus orisasini]|uniref:MmcQ/YjbR family DNA-binding protein n=1 Tax=Streptococcus orisasini TaxID=1080071 RepID=UPI00070C8CE3|nr:MmcQ/YjbR family DNA-binding protein [Streptococcus orisasini]